MIDWRVVPIEHWPGERTAEPRDHRFRTATSSGWTRHGVNWSGTMDLLQRELEHLDAENVLLQMAVEDKDIRKDGWIRANYRPEHDGVILTFDSRFGPLSYPCDTFNDWQANVRAMALALEALRKVDRYGVTRRGEQYSGWKKLPPAGGTGHTMTTELAAEVLHALAGWAEEPESDPDDLVSDSRAVRDAYRDAVRCTHPDRGGSADDFHRVQTAKKVLDAHHGRARG